MHLFRQSTLKHFSVHVLYFYTCHLYPTLPHVTSTALPIQSIYTKDFPHLSLGDIFTGIPRSTNIWNKHSKVIVRVVLAIAAVLVVLVVAIAFLGK